MSNSLLKKPLRSTKKHNRPMIIAVAGVAPGAGCTHFSLVLAHHLRKQRYRVQLVECNGTNDYSRIEEAYHGKSDEKNLSSEGVGGQVGQGEFRAKGITYTKGVTAVMLTEIYLGKYDVIILDLGSKINGFISEMKRADTLYVIGYYNDWNQWLYHQYVNKHSDLLTNRCQLLITFGSKESLRTLKKMTGITCMGVPFILDPFVRTRESGVFINTVMGAI